MIWSRDLILSFFRSEFFSAKTFFRKASKAGKLRSGLLKLKAEIILSKDCSMSALPFAVHVLVIPSKRVDFTGSPSTWEKYSVLIPATDCVPAP